MDAFTKKNIGVFLIFLTMNGTDKFQRCMTEATQLSTKGAEVYKSVLSLLLDGTSKITQQSTELPMHGFWSLLLDCYDRYWRTVYELLANRSRQFAPAIRDSKVLDGLLYDRSQLVSRLTPVNYKLEDLAHLKQHIMDCVKLCEDPMIYYNVSEQNHYYGQLATAYSEYCGDKESFEESLKQANCLRANVSQINKKLCGEGEKILKECERVMRKVNWDLEDTISKHMIGVMEELNKMVANLQAADTDSVLSFQKEEFRREYLQAFSRKNANKMMTKEQLAIVDSETMSRARTLVEEGLKRMKRSGDLLNYYFSHSDEKLMQVRRQIAPIFRGVLSLKLSKNTKELCPSWKPLSLSLKAAQKVVMGFLQFSSQLMRENAQALLNHRQQEVKLTEVSAHLTILLDRPRRLDIRELLDFYYIIYKELETLAQMQNANCSNFKQATTKSLQKYSDSLKQVCSLLKLQDSLIRGSASVNTYEYIRNELLSDIMAQPISWDKHFDNRVQSVLERPYQFPTEEVSAYGDGSYSCALGGKLLLAGRMKIVDNIFCFESSFNKRNIFFGKTKLIIPKNQIMSVQKQTMVMLQNSIQILTKMGPLFFTSFFYRDQAFQQLQDLLYSSPDQDTNLNDQVESLKSEPLDPEEIKLINERQAKVDNKLLEPLANQTLIIEYPDLTLKAFYRIILSNAQARKGGKIYQNFKVLSLKEQKNTEIKCTNLEPSAPSYFDKASDVKFSEAVHSQRQATYKRKLPPTPIPFFPTHSNCTQIQKIHYISTDKIIVEKENSAKGVPFADTFYVKEKMILTEANGSVTAKISFQIVFVSDTSMKGFIKSSAQKQIRASAEIFKNLSQNYIVEVKSRPKAKAGQTLQTKIFAQQQQVEQEKSQSKLKGWQMKALIGGGIALIILIIVLIFAFI